MNIPCKQCITFALCRHKEYLKLFDQCSILKEYEPNYLSIAKRSQTKLQILVDILKPTMWNVMPVNNYRTDHKQFVYINSGYL